MSNETAEKNNTTTTSITSTADDFNLVLIDIVMLICRITQSKSAVINSLLDEIIQLGHAQPNQLIFKLKLKKILAQLKQSRQKSTLPNTSKTEYLESITSQIADVETGFYMATELTEDTSQSQSQFTQALTSSLDDLTNDVAASDNLVDIKQQVSQYLDKIHADVNSQSNKDAIASNQLAGLLSSMQTQLNQLQEQTLAYSAELKQKTKQALTDVLTGLPNRKACDETIATIQYSSDNPICIGVLDIDHFKRINDTYGHIAGDKILQLVAKFVQQQMHDTSFVGRWGGEEFLLILNGHKAADAFVLLSSLLLKIEQLPIQYKDQTIPLTASIGINELSALSDVTDAFDKADIALYHAKQQGRNQVQIGT